MEWNTSSAFPLICFYIYINASDDLVVIVADDNQNPDSSVGVLGCDNIETWKWKFFIDPSRGIDEKLDIFIKSLVWNAKQSIATTGKFISA